MKTRRTKQFVLCLLGLLYAVLLHAQPFEAKIDVYKGRPTIFLNGKAQTPTIYALTDVPGGRWSWEELPQHNLKVFCDSGFQLFQLDLFFDHIWFEDDTFDITLAQKQVQGLQAVCPTAAIMFRFHVSAPKWWVKKHPEEWVRYANTNTYQDELNYNLNRLIDEDYLPYRKVSLASKKWKDIATEKLIQFLQAFEKTPEGEALFALQIADGIYGEWHNWGFMKNEPDTSPAMQGYFQRWLQDKYKNQATLQLAWQKPNITFETVTIPNITERETTKGIFRNPEKEQFVIDYYQCVHEMVAKSIVHFGKTVKETWSRPIITGTFYGYFFSTFDRAAAGGHLEPHLVLESPYIDFLAAPQVYYPEWKLAGEPYRSRSLMTSTRLNGKLALDEMDIEPTLPSPYFPNERLLQKSIAIMIRNVMFPHTKGMGLWYYDFGPSGLNFDNYIIRGRNSQGWWDHPELQDRIRKMKTLVAEKLEKPYQSDADILFVFDTDSYYHTGSLKNSDAVTDTLVNWQTLALFKSSVVFDPIHIDDLDKIDLSPYKLVIFGNTYYLNDARKKSIEKVKNQNRHILWNYAPGYTNGSKLSAQFISAITGIQLEEITLENAPTILLNNPFGEDYRYQIGEKSISPLFAINDTQTQSYGSYESIGKSAFGRKDFPSYTSWYLALPDDGLHPLKFILEEANVHRYGVDGDIFYAGGGFLVMHTKTGGIKTITLKNGKQVTHSLSDGAHTLVMHPETGEILLQ